MGAVKAGEAEGQSKRTETAAEESEKGHEAKAELEMRNNIQAAVNENEALQKKSKRRRQNTVS